MTKKTNLELNDGEAVRTLLAKVAFDQTDQTETLTTSIRPNPANTHYVKNQAQLEAALGVDLIIPASTAVTIVIDDPLFFLSKPIKKQNGSSLLLMSESSNVLLLYSGLGALLQMDTPGVDIGQRTEIDNLTIIGIGTNQALALEETEFFTVHQVFFASFTKVGLVKGGNVVCREIGFVTVGGGIDFIDNSFVDIAGMSADNTSPTFTTPTTLLNFITTGQIDVVLRQGLYVQPNHPDFYVFFDPNSGAGSSFTIRDSGIITTESQSLFQKGSDIAATANADSSPDTQFNITAHNLQVGQYVVLKNFTTFAGYNGTFVVTAVNDANSVDIGVGFLGVDSTGTMNAASLDATNNRVEATSNPDQPDSMSLAESRSLVSISYMSSGSGFDPIQNTVPAVDDFVEDPATERFSVDDETGIITYDGLEPITSTILFEFLLSKVGGGSDPSTVSLFQGPSGIPTQQVKTDQLISLTSTVQKVFYNGGIFDIIPGDTFQLFLDNPAGSEINVSALKVLITRQ